MKSDAFRWGILGCGQILAKICQAFQLTDQAAPVAVASRDIDRARAAAAHWKIPRAHGSYEALIADAEVEVVFNALHNGLHCEWSLRALEAGKHVLCEKPLACSSEEVDRMFAAAHASGRWLMEGFMYRFHPQIAEAKRRVDAGEIGRVQHVYSTYDGLGREASNPRYWRNAGGGALMDIGCYCVNFSRLFAGEPRRVEAGALFGPTSGVDLFMSARLEANVDALFLCSMQAEKLQIGAQITGTEGTLVIEHPWLPPSSPAELRLMRPDTVEKIRVEAPPMPAGPFALEIEHICACIRDNRAPQFPPGIDAEQDSRANMRVIEALLASARSGRTIELCGF